MMKIHLPDRDYASAGHYDYGARKELARYLEVDFSNDLIFGQWQHAWIGEYRNVHPELIIGGNGKSRQRKADGRFFVARRDQETALKSYGYKNVFAIGAPPVYLPAMEYERIPNSLLIVPMHSLPETNEDWQTEGAHYAEFMENYIHRFEHIAICVHSSCMEKNFWANEFAQLGAVVLEGADPADYNSLERMRAMFSQFEFVMSNGYGSQVAYASYWGAKVSVCGPRPKWDSSKRSDVFFKNAPETLTEFEKWRTTNFLDNLYPWFATDPHLAKTNIPWAKIQLGEKNRLDCFRLKKIIARNFKNRLIAKLKSFR